MNEDSKKAYNGLTLWFQNQIANTSLVWLIAIFVAGVLFYSDTTSRLAAHSAAFAEIALQRKDDAIDRERVRASFTAESKAVALGISDLNKQSAVMAAQLVSIQREVEKISNRLDGKKP